VTLLPLVEGAQAYLRRSIAQSGSPVLTRSEDQAIACTDEVMEALGATTVADLKAMDPETLVKASAILALRVWPERDGRTVPLDPYGAYAAGAAKDIQILHGVNKDEMGYFVNAFGVDLYNAWAAGRKAGKLAQLTEEERALVESFCADVEGEDFEHTSRLFDQIVFIAPLFRTANCQAQGGGTSYTYYFTPESANPILRCGHGVEVCLIFAKPELGAEFEQTNFDPTFAKTLRAMWVQFARCGNPSLTAEESPDGRAHEWPVYDPKTRDLMVFDEHDIHVEPESERKVLDWDRCYFLTKYYCI